MNPYLIKNHRFNYESLRQNLRFCHLPLTRAVSFSVLFNIFSERINPSPTQYQLNLIVGQGLALAISCHRHPTSLPPRGEGGFCEAKDG